MIFIPPPEKYRGSAKEYIRNFVITNLPSSNCSSTWHLNLNDYLNNHNDLIIRRAGDHTERGHWRSGDGFRLMISDNEPAVWAFMEAFKGESANLEKSMLDQSFPIAFALKKNEKQIAQWKTRGRKHRELSDVGFKHCHIAPCAPRGRSFTEKTDVQSRMLALLSPMNHFLFPSPRKFIMSKDWGENAHFISLVIFELLNFVYTGEQKSIFLDFLKIQQISPPLSEPKDIEIDFERRDRNFRDISVFQTELTRKGCDLESFISSAESFHSIERNKTISAIGYPIFLETLGNWLNATDEETISNGGTEVGVNGWLYCKYNNHILRLNSDTTRAGVSEFLEQVNSKSNSGLYVINNRDGRFNKIVPEVTKKPIEGFYFYLDTGERAELGCL